MPGATWRMGLAKALDNADMALLDGVEGEPGDEQDEEASAGVFGQALGAG